MSGPTQAAVWALKLPPNEKLAFLALARREGEHGCFPSQATLIEMTGLKESTLRRAIRKLEKAGWITISRERHQSNAYTLHPNKKIDGENAVLQMLKAPVNLTDASTGQSDRRHRSKPPKAPVNLTAYSSIGKKIGEAAKNDGKKEPEKQPASSDRMSRAEYMAKHGTGQPIPTASIAQTTLTQILDRARIETSPQ